MTTRITVTTKIREHFRRYPTANVKDAAQKFNQPVSRIYKLRREVLDENMRVAAMVPDLVPMPTPEHEAGAAAAYALMDAKRTEEQSKERVARYFAGFAAAPTVDTTLNERAQEYGKFKDGAALMQGMKRLLSDHAARHDKTFADDQWEALEMIVHKIARIVNGNPDKVDHWVDIAGYATLVADRLQGVER
jgi:hypothetical protein